MGAFNEFKVLVSFMRLFYQNHGNTNFFSSTSIFLFFLLKLWSYQELVNIRVVDNIKETDNKLKRIEYLGNIRNYSHKNVFPFSTGCPSFFSGLY